MMPLQYINPAQSGFKVTMRGQLNWMRHDPSCECIFAIMPDVLSPTVVAGHNLWTHAGAPGTHALRSC